MSRVLDGSAVHNENHVIHRILMTLQTNSFLYNFLLKKNHFHYWIIKL